MFCTFRWAPEAVWDIKQNAYMVFWASSLYATNDTAHAGTSYHRILKSTTTDFKSFTPAEVYIDYGWSVIDTTMVHDTSTGTYYRFNKDERSPSSGTPDSKFIAQEKSNSITGTWTGVVAGIGKGVLTRGEGPTVFKSNTVANKVRTYNAVPSTKKLKLFISGTCLSTSMEVIVLLIVEDSDMAVNFNHRPRICTV
jgi:hypothetical protein